jgi:hypothetical protein
MPAFDLQAMRMRAQMLTHRPLAQPKDVLSYMVAMQAQDYFGALWAVGMRTRKPNLAAVEQAFVDGELLRTHVMRPTWHFVAPQDIRWLLSLTAPRVHAVNAGIYRDYKLDAATVAKAHKAFEKALHGLQFKTREELAKALGEAGIEAKGIRLGYFMMQAELEQLIVSGPRRGKQFTYALLDERARPTKTKFDRKEALAQFALRYFTSRGPATPQDFAYWSGLTLADAKAGLSGDSSELRSHKIEGTEYWFSEAAAAKAKPSKRAFLHSNYDEIGMSYKDLGAVFDRKIGYKLFDYAYSHIILLDGKVAGSWRRVLAKTGITVETRPIYPLSTAQKKQITEAADDYQAFVAQPVKVKHGKALLRRSA